MTISRTSPLIVFPDLVIELETITAICAGTLAGGDALFPGRDVHVLPHAGGEPFLDEANPLNELGAEPPERPFALAHCAPHQVTDAPTAAFRSPMTKAPITLIGVDVGVAVNGTVLGGVAVEVEVAVGVEVVVEVTVAVVVAVEVSVEVAVEVEVGVEVEVAVKGTVPGGVAVKVAVSGTVAGDVAVDVGVALDGVVPCATPRRLDSGPPGAANADPNSTTDKVKNKAAPTRIPRKRRDRGSSIIPFTPDAICIGGTY